MAQYQQMEPIFMSKYEDVTYHKGYFCGGNNIDLNLITCEDDIFILSIPQNYVLHWDQAHLLHT